MPSSRDRSRRSRFVRFLCGGSRRKTARLPPPATRAEELSGRSARPIIRIVMALSRLWMLAGALTFLALPTVGTAQAPRRPATPLQAAARALVEGRYGEIDSLTDKLDAKDPNVAALRARALMARGKYSDAEEM